MNWQDVYSRFERRSRRLVRDKDEVARAVGKAYEKAHQNRDWIATIWDDLQTAMRLVRCWVTGDYRQVTRSTLVTLVGALAYFVCPLDAVVDAIPGLGLLDDAAVLGFALRNVRQELNAFRKWEAQAALPAASAPAG